MEARKLNALGFLKQKTMHNTKRIIEIAQHTTVPMVEPAEDFLLLESAIPVQLCGF